MPKLRQALEREFGGGRGADGVPPALLDSEIVQVFLSTGAPCDSHSGPFSDWPGMEQDVQRWFQLDCGASVGLRSDGHTVRGVAIWEPERAGQVDWNRLRTFQMVTEVGSFTKAGFELDLTQSAVSRQIAALEREVGAALFIRSGRGLVLTEAGRYFLDTVKAMSKTLDLGLSRLNELRAKPEGPLRITTTVGFGSAWLTSRINKFHTIYPDIQISLLLIDDHELDLQQSEADCAIRFEMPKEPGLVQLYIDAFAYKIYASQAYIDEHGAPADLDALSTHDLIVYGQGVGAPPVQEINWLLSIGLPTGERRKPALQVNSVYGIYRAVESGMGVAALPFYMSERSGDLVEILPEIEGPRIPLYFVYPEELRPSRRIHAVRDFLIEEIRSSWRLLKSQSPAAS